MRSLIAIAMGLALPVALQAQATDTRTSLLARAQVWTPTDVGGMDIRRGPDRAGGFPLRSDVRCQFVERSLTGTSPKFACVLPSGDEIKVKYGEANGEVHGEVAATRLLWALGFGADAMYPVRVICRGCPDTIGRPAAVAGERLVDPAVIERKMPGRELMSGDQPGWSWLELDLIAEQAGGATRSQRDALKLLAVMIQHTDSKPEQQRLVCLDDGEGPADTCERTFMMINDVGLTFGRANLTNRNHIGSVNLQEWARTPVWKEEGACVGNLPRSLTGTLKDPVISEAGRSFLSERLMALSDAQIRAVFEVARVDLRSLDARTVPQGASIDEWVRVFKAKRKEIVDRRCEALWPGGISALFGTAPIHWLQDRSSGPLTAIANVVSLFGYTRVNVAIAVVLAFTVGFRAGAALLLLLALTGVFTDGAKAVVSAPRPMAVDPTVRNLDAVYLLSDSFRSESAAPSVDAEDGYGFPSGHVAVATAFLFGLGYFFQWRWVWPLMAFWIPAMALTRLYLGRHFLGDVLGGVGVGVVAATFGFLALTLARLSNPKRAMDAAARTLIVAGGCALVALAAGIGVYDTGRFLGLAASVMLLVHERLAGVFAVRDLDGASIRARMGRLALAALAFTAVWRGTDAALDATGMLHTPAGALLAGALPVFVLLPAPFVLEHLMRAVRAWIRGVEPRVSRRRLHKRRA